MSNIDGRDAVGVDETVKVLYKPYSSSFISLETFDSDDEGGSGGMGISVSTMAPPLLDEQDMKSLYGLALANDVSGLSLYLGAHPNVNINELDEHGYTALHLACDRGNAAMVDFLLQRGADSGARDPDDFTALQLANVAGHGDIVNLLDRSSTSPM